MNLFRRWFWPHSPRSEALSWYKQGMARAEKADPAAAMQAFTTAIEFPDGPDDVKAMALYNRALLFAAQGKANKALIDLQAVMEMPTASRDVKLAVKRRLERLQNREDAATRPKRNASS